MDGDGPSEQASSTSSDVYNPGNDPAAIESEERERNRPRLSEEEFMAKIEEAKNQSTDCLVGFEASQLDPVSTVANRYEMKAELDEALLNETVKNITRDIYTEATNWTCR